MDSNRNRNRSKLKQIVFIILYLISIMLVFALFRVVCTDLLHVLLWWTSVAFLISGFTLLLVYANKNIMLKRKRLLIIDESLFMGVGGILLVLNSFLFIKNIYIAILLVLSVLFLCISLGLLQYWLVKKDVVEPHQNDSENQYQ